MSRLLLMVFLTASLCFNLFAALSGTKTIPGDYSTIASAVIDLNSSGVGSGGVTFNVAAGYTESITSPILITATGTSSNPIVFQKSGGGANPLITRTDAGSYATSGLGAQGDAVLIIQGTDYITFDAINVAASQQGIEYGYYFRKASATNGCKNVIIKNASVTMTKGTSAYVVGIYTSNNDASSGTLSPAGITVTSTGGRNENVTIIGNTISNVHVGIFVNGYNHPSPPYDFYDQNFVIGQSGAGNTIQNFGGGVSLVSAGIYLSSQNLAEVNYNTINNTAGGGSSFTGIAYGIWEYQSTNSSTNINYNNITLSSGVGSSALNAIKFGTTGTGVYHVNNNAISLSMAGSAGANCITVGASVASITVNNNTFGYGTFTSINASYLINANYAINNISIVGNQTTGTINKTGTSGNFYCYYINAAPTGGSEQITNNNFSNITLSGNSSFYGIYSNTASAQNRTCGINTISNITVGTGTTYCLYLAASTGNEIFSNNIYNITAGGTVYGLYFSGVNPNAYSNNVYSLTISGTTLYGIYNKGTGTTNLYKNRVYNLTANNTSAAVYGLTICSGTANYNYNNFISDLKAPTGNNPLSLAGVYVLDSTASIYLYNNTIFLNATSSGTSFGSAGVYAATTPTFDMQNNIIVNTSTPGNGSYLAKTVAFKRSSSTLSTYYSQSNRNLFYAGTPDSSRVIYFDNGSTLASQTISSYKTLVSPRDAYSFSENPPFVNAAAAPYDLHISTGISTLTSGGGSSLTTAIPIADDFDGDTRHSTAPDIGADEFGVLSGTKTIPGDYATIALAVADLNAQGVNFGGVTFNVAAGYTENITNPILITTPGGEINQIVFQKSGVGANPLVTRTDAGSLTTSTLGGQGDAVIIIQGTDYITFDGISVAASNSGIEYGYYLRKASTMDACKYVTIKNASVTMTKGTSRYVVGIYSSNNDASSLVSSSAGIAVVSTGGRHENVTLTGNTISNVHHGIVLFGFNDTTFYDQGFIIGQSGAGNTIRNFAGSVVASSYGIYFLYHKNININYNTIDNAGGGGTNATSSLYGIYTNQTSALGTFAANYNNITLGQGSTLAATCIYNAAEGTSVTINNNTFGYGTFASSSTSYLIYNNNLSAGITVSGNQTTGVINRTGTLGPFYGYYNYQAPDGGTETISNNNFSNITLTGTSYFYGIYTYTPSAPLAKICSGNVISGITIGSSSSASYIIYAYSMGSSSQIFNNNIYNITASGDLNLISFSGTNASVYGNTIYNDSTTGANLCGILNGSSNVSCYKNRIYDLTVNNSSGVVYGIKINSGTANYIYNNFISDLKSPVSNLDVSIAGIYLNGGTMTGLYYNTIYLNAGSSASGFGSAGVYAITSPTLDMRNNIIVNTSTPGNGSYTAKTAAYRRANSSLTYYSSVSDNNLFYAGIPDSARVIYFDGGSTPADQSITSFKSRVSPRDEFSFSENPPFVNISSAPYDLHMSTEIITSTESGGTPVSTPLTITTDYDNNTRNESTPDVGADEFDGFVDIIAPTISYTPLVNGSSTAVRTLVVTVTDVTSGVPTTAPGWPYLYWRINSGSWTAVAPSGVSGSNYTYNFGAGTTTGDVVQYYVVAQDMSAGVNVGAYPSAGAGGFSINPPAASIPPSSPDSYTIQTALSGSYTVGTALFNRLTGKNITFEKSVRTVMKDIETTSLKQGEQDKSDDALIKPQTSKKLIPVEEATWIPMENGRPYTGELYVKKSEHPELSFPMGIMGVYASITAAITDLNLRGVSGATTFLLADASYTTETLPLTINISSTDYLTTSANTVTIKPNNSVTTEITGASASGPVFKIQNSYIIIDGSNSGGTDRSLTITNTSTEAAQVIFIASTGTTSIENVTIKNSIIINGTNTTPVLSVSGITGTGGYFKHITIQNNSIQKAYRGIYVYAQSLAGNGTMLISGNDLNSVTNPIKLQGIYVYGVDTTTISNNNISFANTTDVNDIMGIFVYYGSRNCTVSGNNIGTISGTLGGPTGIGISTAQHYSNIIVTGNIINGITTSSTNESYGVHVFGSTAGVIIEKNKISNIKVTNPLGSSATGIRLFSSTSDADIIVKNNFIWDIAAYGTDSYLYYNAYGISILYGGGYKLYHNSVALTTNQSAALGRPACLYIGSSVTASATLEIKNNIFANFMTVGAEKYVILCNGASTVFSDLNYNDYYTTGTNLGYYSSSNVSDLPAWRTAVGQDVNSVSGDPHFKSTTNLHMDSTYYTVNNNGSFLASVTTDIDGDARNNPPDIGADEYLPLVQDPSSVAAFAGIGQINIQFTKNAYGENVVIVYNTTGIFTAPSGAPPAAGLPFAGGTVAYYGGTSPYTHTPLPALTTYYYMVFSYDAINVRYSTGVLISEITGTSYPYTETFDTTGITTPAGWYTGMSLTTGHGTGSSNGLSASMYDYNPYIISRSPIIGPLSGTASVQFEYRIVNYSGYPGTGTVLGSNYIAIQTSPDNVTWTTRYTIDSSNHTTSVNFASRTIDLSALSGQNTFVRFVCVWASGDYWVDIDNFRIGSPLPDNPQSFTVTAVNGSRNDLTFTRNIAGNRLVIVYNSTGTFTTPFGIPPSPGSSFAGGTVLYIGTASPINHSGLTTGTTYYYKAFSDDGANYSLGVTGNATPVVNNPTSVTAVPSGTSQINLSWVKNANNDYVMVVTNSVNTFGTPVNGSTYTVGSTIPGGGTVIYYGSALLYNHTSLTINTIYYYKLYSAEFYEHNYSSGVAAVSNTPFVPPYRQGFDEVTFPPLSWLITKTGSGNNWARTSGTIYSGAGAIYYGYNSYDANAWAITPAVQLTAGRSYRISFYQKVGNASKPERLKLTIGTSPDPAALTTVLWDNAGGSDLTNTTYTLRYIDYSCTSTGLYYLGLNCYSLASKNNLFVDEFFIRETPLVDFELSSMSQLTGLPSKLQKITDNTTESVNEDEVKETDVIPCIALQKNTPSALSTNENKTGIINSLPKFTSGALNPISFRVRFRNLGLNWASYDINWAVSGSSQPAYDGGLLGPGVTDSVSLTYNPLNRGTFLTTGYLVVTGDEDTVNNSGSYRMRVYPNVFTQRCYDRGTNTPDNYVGYISGDPIKAGVRFTASSTVKLAGADYYYRTESVVSGTFIVQVRAAGGSTGAPGALLYTQCYSTSDYITGTGDLVHFAFGDDAPVIAGGSDYWITIKAPTGINYPGGVHTSGFTAGRSFYEETSDTTIWYDLGSYGWMLRSIEMSVSTASITAMIEGFYNGTEMVSDTVTVELRNSSAPYSLVESADLVLGTSGTGSGIFTSVVNAVPYYIVVKHRNAIETWSAMPQPFSSLSMTYNFTDAQTKAFGNNMRLVGSKWCFYGGDANQDGVVDGADLANVDNDATLWATGYIATDINGDGVVDGADLATVDNNATNWIYVQSPSARKFHIDRPVIKKNTVNSK